MSKKKKKKKIYIYIYSPILHTDKSVKYSNFNVRIFF